MAHPNTMSALRRLTRLGVIVCGLLAGCNDDLGRDRYAWDSGALYRAPADSGRDGQDSAARVDASITDGPREASSDANSGADTRDVTIESIVDATLVDAAESTSAEWGDAGAVLTILLAESPSCLACAQASCPSEIVGCSSVSGRADGGPDASLPRAQLCAETLQCLLSTGCEELDTSTCYCGDVVHFPGACVVPSVANGACAKSLERSLETVDPQTILSSLFSTDRGGGWAMLLARCMRDNQCLSCFPSVDAGADAKSPIPSEESQR